MKIRSALGIGLFGVAVLGAIAAPNTYYLFLLAMIAITTMVGVGLNVLIGLSGQVSIGHAGFFAIGAYAGALLLTKAGWNFWLALGLAGITAATTGMALAAPALRVTGPYLAMVTIAFGIIVERVLIEWVSLTGGFGGISVPKPSLLGLQPTLRLVVLLAIVFAALAVIAFSYLKQHPWGKAFQAVKNDEIAATSVGLNVLQIRVIAFAISAGFTGIAGVFFASAVGFISPDSFTFYRSILFLLVVILGGLNTAEGAIFGAIILVLLPEFLHDFADYQLIVFGSLLILTLWIAPNGLVSLLFDRFNRTAPIYPLNTPPTEIPALIGQNREPSTLQVSQVGIRFGGLQALQDVDLTAEPGTITAVIGPNGAGKTTLLNLISGFYRTQSGHVLLGTTDLTNQSSLAIAHSGITRTFQSTRLFNSLSVLDNLRVARFSKKLGNPLAALAGIGRTQQPEKTLLELLAFVGYHGNVQLEAASLPFVDRRLVEIARALATSPQVLLLDEPAAGLSPEDKIALATLIRRIASTGIKVILIEHDMELVMNLSDRVLVLDSGQLICEGLPKAVQQDQRVLAAYLGVSDLALTRSISAHSEPLLQIENLVSGYGSLQVLDQVSLTVNAGELVAVVGANGSGKSTLLKSICGLIRPWSGEVRFAGTDLSTIAAHHMADQGIVLVPEGRQIFIELSVYDNIRLGAYRRSDQDAIQADIQSVLTRFPRLQERQHQRAGLLSGGEQQMLAIARGLMARPKVLLLDEPSLGLAPKLVTALYETLAELRDEGITILLVDQMAKLALSIADRAYLLEGGRIVHSGSATEMQQDPAIAHAYLGGS
jgi:branched-chain amino acid transport system ATP-binding protein